MYDQELQDLEIVSITSVANLNSNVIEINNKNHQGLVESQRMQLNWILLS